MNQPVAGVKVIDKGMKRVLEQNRKADGLVVKVGIQASEAEDLHQSGSPMTNLGLGVIHEFGAVVKDGFGKGIRIEIPARSFMRSTFDENEGKYNKILAKAQAAGIPPQAALFEAGETHRADILKKVNAGIPPPLTDFTLERKQEGGTTPLIDTGIMIGAITSVMGRRGS